MWLFLLVAVSSSWIHTVNLTFSGRYLRNNNYIIAAFNNAYPRRRYNNNFCLGDVWFLREDNNVTCNMFVNSHTMVNEVHKVIPFCATFSCSTNMQLIFFQTSWIWPNTFIKTNNKICNDWLFIEYCYDSIFDYGWLIKV